MTARRVAIELIAPGAVGATAAAARLHVETFGWLGRLVRRTFGRSVDDVPPAGSAPPASIRRMWVAYVVMAVAALAAAVLNLPDAPLAALAGCSMAIAAAAGAVRMAYAHWIARGGVGGWRAFSKQPQEWVPAQVDSDISNSSATAIMAIVAIVALLPASAAAEPNLVGQVIDIGTRIIGAIFPTAGNPWTHALGQFTDVLVAGGGVMLAWHTVAGTVATAHEGKLLGSRFHQIWAPVRVSIGMGLLFPVPGAGGLDSAQIALASAAAAGSGVASAIYRNFATSVLTVSPTGGSAASGGSLGIPTAVGGAELARRIMVGEVCEQVRVREDASDDLDIQVPLPASGGTAKDGVQVWDWGAGCGSISVTASATTDTTKTATKQDVAAASYATARIAAIQAEYISIRGVAKNWALGSVAGTGTPWPEGPLAPVLTSVGAAYDSSMTAAAGTYLAVRDGDARQQVAALATSDGWTSSGALYGSLGAASAAVTALASEAPGYVEPRPEEIYGWCPAEAPANCQGDVVGALKHLRDVLIADDRAAGGRRRRW